MITPEEIAKVRNELGTLLGWKRQYDDLTDPGAINWRDHDGQLMALDLSWYGYSGILAMLMTEYTTGYYETRAGTKEHCYVIGSPSNTDFESTVVYLRNHKYDKKHALAYAVMVASVKQLKAYNGIKTDRVYRTD